MKSYDKYEILNIISPLEIKIPSSIVIRLTLSFNLSVKTSFNFP